MGTVGEMLCAGIVIVGSDDDRCLPWGDYSGRILIVAHEGRILGEQCLFDPGDFASPKCKVRLI